MVNGKKKMVNRNLFTHVAPSSSDQHEELVYMCTRIAD